MKHAENRNLPTFQGAGYLLGGAITMVIGIALFIWTENITIAISAAVPIGTTMGILMEQRFQNGDLSVGEPGRKWLLGLLILGIIVFIAVFFIA